MAKCECGCGKDPHDTEDARNAWETGGNPQPSRKKTKAGQ